MCNIVLVFVCVCVQMGVDVNTPCRNGRTPLHAAVLHPSDFIVVFLLKHKANVNAVDKELNSVLHIAAAHGYPGVVLLLLKAGASATVLNDREETPLDVAKSAEICRIILGE